MTLFLGHPIFLVLLKDTRFTRFPSPLVDGRPTFRCFLIRQIALRAATILKSNAIGGNGQHAIGYLRHKSQICMAYCAKLLS